MLIKLAIPKSIDIEQIFGSNFPNFCGVKYIYYYYYHYLTIYLFNLQKLKQPLYILIILHSAQLHHQEEISVNWFTYLGCKDLFMTLEDD